jgi:hypothetical protein
MAASVFLSKSSSSPYHVVENPNSDDCLYFVRGSDEFERKKSAVFDVSGPSVLALLMLPIWVGETSMKFKTKLVTSVLAGAMLALPMLSAPAFAEPDNSVNSNYVQRVDWWHHDHDDGYRNRGYYYGNRYYGNRYAYGYGYRGYGACANARRLQNQAWRDNRTGHPAAAWDVAQQARWARARCY